jgi:hypothetical protein
MLADKVVFLQEKFIPLLQTLDPLHQGEWGIMNAQQMVEHFGDAVKNASGKLKVPQLTTGEQLIKMRTFLMSEKPFKENIDNPLMNKNGIPLRYPTMNAAIERLERELHYFFGVFKNDANLITLNAFFGELDYEMNVQLLYKHALHHLKQFSIIVA